MEKEQKQKLDQEQDKVGNLLGKQDEKQHVVKISDPFPRRMSREDILNAQDKEFSHSRRLSVTKEIVKDDPFLSADERRKTQEKIAKKEEELETRLFYLSGKKPEPEIGCQIL